MRDVFQAFYWLLGWFCCLVSVSLCCCVRVYIYKYKEGRFHSTASVQRCCVRACSLGLGQYSDFRCFCWYQVPGTYETIFAFYRGGCRCFRSLCGSCLIYFKIYLGNRVIMRDRSFFFNYFSTHVFCCSGNNQPLNTARLTCVYAPGASAAVGTLYE